ncbi:MAG: FliM/FliN family flagellar motor switch protein, partial [Thiovulaceae bacterium]|nr:FliM/FliN family flagellar motor switch protein [Sulfurimonadaceae bacterium]
PLLPRLASRDLMLNETSSKKSRNQELKALVGGAEVQMDAILGRTEISLAELLDIEPGNVLRLETAGSDDKIWVNVDGKDRFIGSIGLRRFKKSVRIDEIIFTEKDEVKEVLEFFEDERLLKLKEIKVKENDI